MKDYNKITIETYNKTAKEYVENVKELVPMNELEKFVNYILSGKVLDIGCGSGVSARSLQERGLQVYGIDLSKELLKEAKKESPNSNFYYMDMLRINFSGEMFDGIWNVASLLHLEKKKVPIALFEANRVLKKNGLMYLSVKEGEGESLEEDKRYGGLPKYYAYYKSEEIENLLEVANFKILENDSNLSRSNYHSNALKWINIFAKKK